MTLVTKETVFDALDEIAQHMTPHQLLDAVFQALSTDQCADTLEHIVRLHELVDVGPATQDIVRSIA
jgi:hypothetical protein